jgi:SAM-dependent methyltransferase
MSGSAEAAKFESGGYLQWKGWAAEEFGRYTAAESLYFSAELDRAGIRSGRILELGFGNGGFAAWAKDSGRFEYHGIEADSELIARARSAGFSASEKEGWINEGAFDAIIAFDVLEHIPMSELPRLLKSICTSLRNGGVFLARFPSGDSPFARHTQHGDITHCTVIGAGIVNQLAQQSDLDPIQVRSPAFPVRGLGAWTLLRRSCVVILRSIISGILRIAFFDNVPQVITANMVIVLRKR